MIYLDNAATTIRKPPAVADAVLTAMSACGNVGRGSHGYSLDAARTVYGAREKLAQLFSCPRADHVIFTQNSTAALNITLFGLFSAGDHVISTDLEHNSVLRPLYRLVSQDVAVDFLPADTQGELDYDLLPTLLRKNTRAVVCTHASNLTGAMPDMAKIAAFCRENGLLLIVDASQTAGTTTVNMETLGADVLCFAGHKGLMGPQGTGGLCIREGVEIRPFIVGGTGVQTYLTEQPPQYPTRLEAGTLNASGIAGLSAAVDFILTEGAERIHAKETSLLRRFLGGVEGVKGVTLYGDLIRPERAAIAALNVGDLTSAEAADRLFENYSIAVRAGAHCAPRLHRALGTEERGAVRFSFGYYNTPEEADAAAAAVRELAAL